MPYPQPSSLGRILGDAIAVPCVAALVIPIIAMVFTRWNPVYGAVATRVAVIADIGWGGALFVSGIRRLREEPRENANPECASVLADVAEKGQRLADDW
ncbi:hypothetical protein [Amycolatopsis sp. DG1A-15b]|uniref:hypothetical protein n=1 Tax=Amycolatopsis sp. DG1A-15b TaxID=3052846 RepID=UPI00255B475F|nr:hypothetical protein [Amycolatopsis sp. DG1A-15b]WIX85755.1 hypothetical protein QRY02_31695 [Amycolatopsis sp. DG1A-15b]